MSASGRGELCLINHESGFWATSPKRIEYEQATTTTSFMEMSRHGRERNGENGRNLLDIKSSGKPHEYHLTIGQEDRCYTRQQGCTKRLRAVSLIFMLFYSTISPRFAQPSQLRRRVPGGRERLHFAHYIVALCYRHSFLLALESLRSAVVFC
jgi:hypothetical protein